jgi:RNA polymerase sigma-70 factor (ECF subfamily)
MGVDLISVVAESGLMTGGRDPRIGDMENEEPLEYGAFFRSEFAPVLRMIALMLHDQGRAEEITQDAFVQLLLQWPKVSRYERPDAWVRRVAIRMAVRSGRRERLFSLLRAEFRAPSEPTGGSHDVAAAICQLSTSQRAAIVLHYYEDRPVAEIAAILGCAEATARVHLHRGRRRLAVLLGEVPDVV